MRIPRMGEEEGENVPQQHIRKLVNSYNLKRANDGKKPVYFNKTDLKLIELAKKFEKLKSEGKIESHLVKRRKRLSSKQKKKSDNY
ncbi:hypothetical protein SNEBB_008470 [Seison nebaliae]|nr:hypothetical protein SNEBB_008470 [Seison nebaliae]